MCVQDVIKEFGLREAVGAEDQTYALGLKEVWQVRRGFLLFVHFLISYTLLACFFAMLHDCDAQI